MRIQRIRIKNFRNFKDLDISVGDQIVIVGENKIGKTNLVHALRLVLDPSLPDSARKLQKSDFWDGLGEDLTQDHVIEISIDLTDFEYDDDMLAVLAEHLIAPKPMVSRLTYRFQPIPGLGRDPKSDADFEFLVYGGDRPENRIGYDVRSRIPLDVLPALRDAERDLATWTHSPLRPLLDEAVKDVDRESLKTIAGEVQRASNKVLDIRSALDQPQVANEGGQSTDISDISLEQTNDLNDKPLRKLDSYITKRLTDMAGTAQAFQTMLGVSPTDPDRLLRAIRLFIDGGKRGIGDASLGSANLLYLTLKSLELDLLAEQGQRNHTFLAIEEPEAHLHPHLQRLVYREFLRRRPHQEKASIDGADALRHQTVLLTTHSPHVVSVAPLRSIVLLKHSPDGTHTVGSSTAALKLTRTDEQDLERYLDVTRAELLFARGVVLVEGVAEEYLVPALAKLQGADFDELGISVCSVNGTNFTPYVKLLGSEGLQIPFVILTDLDPQVGKPPLGHNRVISLLQEILPPGRYGELSDDQRLECASQCGIFLNSHTLEIDLFNCGYHRTMCKTLIELTTNGEAKKRALKWCKDPSSLEPKQLVKDISAIGKGRFAQRLASRVRADTCPDYITEAIWHVVIQCG